MGKLFHYLRFYKKESILGPLFKLLEATFELLVPLVMAQVIDVGIKHQDTPYILQMCGIMVLLGVIGLVCSLTAQYFAARASVGFTTSVRRDLFSHIEHLSYSEIDTLGTSTLITRMTSDLNQVQSGLNLALRLLLRSPFVVFGAMVMAFTIDIKAAIPFVIIIPLLSVVVFGIMLITIPLYKKVQNRLDQVTLTTRENLTGVRVIRAFHKEEEETARFADANSALTGIQLFVGRISALLNPVTYIIINAGILAVIWTGAWQVEDGILTQGAVVALINYMSQILVELVKLANLIITITKAVACGNRIQAVFEVTSSMEFPAGASSSEKAFSGNASASSRQNSKESNSMESGSIEIPAVVFDHVSFTYKDAKAESLSDIHFTAKKGETIGIIGGTGSGKTSLVNLIPRFYDATNGSIQIFGRDIKAYTADELRDQIGVVPQKAVLFKGTIADNLRFGKQDATPEEMKEALSFAQASDFVSSKAGGLNAVVEQNGRNFSGGQKQRLTIARAFIRKPQILILDDSASALDYATDARLRQAIRDMSPNITVFVVSQRTSSIRHADQIIVLDDGQVAGIGTHDELLADCEVYQEIYYSQYPKEAESHGEK